MSDDLALHGVVPEPSRDSRAGLVSLLAHLGEAEGLAAEVGRDDRLRYEPHLCAVDGQPRAARIVAPRFEHDAREPERRRCAVALEAGAALELSLVERDRPAETALVRGHGRVVLDAANDEAPFDPEEVEGCHPDELHSLRLRRLDEGVPEIQRAVPIDPELVPELGRVAEPRHEDRDARDLDVLPKAVVR